MASYPGAIKSFVQQADLVDTIDAADINEAYDEIEAIETELGTAPSTLDDTVAPEASPADVADVLDQFATAIKTLFSAANWYATPVAIVPSGGWAAKGDIISASAADTPILLTVAGNNRIIRANSGASSGLSWDKRQYVQLTVTDFTTNCATGDGQAYLHVPAHLDGLDLVEVHAECITAGTTGTMSIAIYNVTDSVDMLSTLITIDTTPDTGSDEATTPAVIYDDGKEIVAENDVLRIDVDAVHTTPAKGLILTLGFA